MTEASSAAAGLYLDLMALRSSSAWRVGSALTALPAVVRRRRRARRN